MPTGLKINKKVTIDDKEIHWHFVRSSGPGGQNVNKVATAAQLRFNVKKSTSLSDEVKKRLIERVGNRLTTQGELIITARRFRTQNRNRQDALARLKHFIELASHEPKKRKKTKTPRAVKEKRLSDKHKRSQTKRLRQRPVE